MQLIKRAKGRPNSNKRERKSKANKFLSVIETIYYLLLDTENGAMGSGKLSLAELKWKSKNDNDTKG